MQVLLAGMASTNMWTLRGRVCCCVGWRLWNLLHRRECVRVCIGCGAQLREVYISVTDSSWYACERLMECSEVRSTFSEYWANEQAPWLVCVSTLQHPHGGFLQGALMDLGVCKLGSPRRSPDWWNASNNGIAPLQYICKRLWKAASSDALVDCRQISTAALM